MGKVRLRIGFRGAILLCAGWVIGWLGVMLVVGVRGMPPAADSLAPDAWGAIWLLVAAICFASALGERDRWGFSTAAGLLGLWVVFWFLSWLESGSAEAWMWSAVWLGGTGIMLICAGWRDA